MSTPLNLLIVEDHVADAELMVRRLRQTGFEPAWLRVETESAFLAALATPLDLVLCDYHLPHFDGLRALTLLREHDAALPFILVSSELSDEIALTVMQQGADDCLHKDRIALLGYAALNALEKKRLHAEKRHAEQTLRDSEQRFRALIEHSGDAIALLAAEGAFLYISPSAIRVLGYTPEELLQQNTFALIHPDDTVEAQARFAALFTQPDVVARGEMRMRHKDGSWRWIEAFGSNMLDEPSVRAIVASYRDIGEHKRAAAEIIQLNAELEQRVAKRTAELEKQYERMAALAELELAINQTHELQAVLNQIAQITTAFLPATGGASIVLWNGETESFDIGATTTPGQTAAQVASGVRREGGATRWIVDNHQPYVVPDVNMDPFREGRAPQYRMSAYVGVPLLIEDKALGVLYALDTAPREYTPTDVDFIRALATRAAAAIAKVRLFEETQRLAAFDSLTGVHNRRHFFAIAEHEFKRARRYRFPLSAIMLDVDRFKSVNDTYGHATGDQVLRVVAKRVQEGIRTADTLGRYGGEEFAVLLPETDWVGAQTVAERLRQRIAEAKIEGLPIVVNVTISLGVAQLQEKISDVDILFDCADQALYAAKQAGRNRVMVYGH
jgi:diguanylate cyclase (GGDEF)-like protein/PAS domain S-box-containing protein